MQFPSLLGHAQELLTTIRKSSKPADHLIDSFFRSHKYLGSHDRRFIAETVYGTLRHQRRCEAMVNDALSGHLDGCSTEDSSLLFLAAYLVKVDHRKDVTPGALEPRLRSPVLKSSLLRFLSGIANRKDEFPKDVVQRIGSIHSFPDWMVQRFIGSFGEQETEELCASLNEPAPFTIRVNALKTTVEQCQDTLKKEGIETTRAERSPFGLHLPKRINIFQLEAFRNGLFEVQDEGSQILPLLIDPKPTWKVLDACAGAGGKTLQLASMMQNRGEIFAVDVHSVRLDALRKRAKRAGAFNVRVVALETFESTSANFNAFFDAVLIDAPCSGLGTIRRNPGLKWSVNEQGVNELSEKQFQILQSNARYLKAGGKMFYATCTILEDENEAVVRRFLELNPEFRVVEPSALAGKWALTSAVGGEYFRLLPHRHGTDGFFCAVFERAS